MKKNRLLLTSLLAFSTLAFAFNANAAKPVKKPTFLDLPIFSQTIRLGMPLSWVPIYKDAEGNTFLTEFMPKGQNANEWTEMVSVTAQKDKANDEKANLSTYENTIKNRVLAKCPENLVYEKLESLNIDGYDAVQFIAGCSKMTSDSLIGLKLGQSEMNYFMIIKGSNDIYTIQKAIRADGFDKDEPTISSVNYKKFISIINPIRVCNETNCADLKTTTKSAAKK